MKQTDRVGTCSSLSKIKGFFEKNSFSDLCSATGFDEFSSDHLSAPLQFVDLLGVQTDGILSFSLLVI